MKKYLDPMVKWLNARIPGVIDNLAATIIIAVLGILLVYFRDRIIPWILLAIDRTVHSLDGTLLGRYEVLLLIAFIGALTFVARSIARQRRIRAWSLDVIPKDDEYEVLSAEIRRVLGATGFSIEHSSVPGVEIVAVNPLAKPYRRIAAMVEPNANTALTRANVKAQVHHLGKAGVARGFYIARESRAFFKEKRITVAARKRIEFTTYRDFVLKGITFEPYLRHLISEWETSRVSRNYIEVAGHDEAGHIYQPLESLLDEIFSCPDDAPSCVVLLGDFGSGKTTFLRHHACMLAQRYLLSPLSEQIPVFVSLREFELTWDMEKLVGSVLGQHGVHGDVDVVSDPQLVGKVVLILDGLDEMSLSADRTSVQRNLQLVEGLASSTSRSLIISCRTHFFRDSKEEDQLQSCFHVYLEPWYESEVKQYLQKTVGDDWERTLGYIKRTYNLQELAQTPLFLDMIVESLGSLEGEHITSSELYTIYTSDWIDTQAYKAVLDRDQKAMFMEHLAWKMITEGKRFIPWTELRNAIQQQYRLSIVQIDRFDNDIRTCSFLNRQDGDYAFIHKSFLEFFVAQYLARQVRAGCIEGMCRIELSYEVMKFLAELLDESVYYERLHLWLEFKTEPQFALARRNVAHIMRIMSRSPLPPNIQSMRAQRSSELAGVVISDHDTETRWKAIVELGWLRSRESGDILRRVLSNGEKDDRVFRITTIVLGLLGDVSATPFITEFLHKGESRVVRQNCAVSLGLLGNSAAIPDLIQCLQIERDHWVRRSAVWAIESIDPVMAREALADTAVTDASEEVRQYAALALGRIGGNVALGVLEQMLKSDDSISVRCSVLESIGHIGGPKALRIARSALNDPNERVKASAHYCINLLRNQ